jgi:hypothetical protein
MVDVFDTKSSGKWTFNAAASTLLKLTTLGLDTAKVEFAAGPDLKPTHDAQYWADKTRGFDFSGEDRVPSDLYNRILWEGLKGTPTPVTKSSFSNLSAGREMDKDE